MIGRSTAIKAAVALIGIGVTKQLFAAKTRPARPAASDIVRRQLLHTALPGSSRVSSLHVAQIDFAPAQESGLHFHPMPVVGQVTRGTILFQVDGGAPQTLEAGDAFYEPANTRMLHFDNASDRAPASFVAIYLMEREGQELFVPLHPEA